MSETSLDYVDALKIAESVMAGIANDEFIGKFYRKGIEGTPLVNDIAVRMALSMQDTFNQQAAELERLRIGYERYETARLMSPRQWADAYQLNISTGKKFDEIIDELKPFLRPTSLLTGVKE
jgi:hypothetical protein